MSLPSFMCAAEICQTIINNRKESLSEESKQTVITEVTAYLKREGYQLEYEVAEFGILLEELRTSKIYTSDLAHWLENHVDNS